MKITIQRLIDAWNMINVIYSMNDSYPGSWDAYMNGNFRVMQPIVEQMKDKGKDWIEERKDREIELPLFPISISDLPKNVPPGAAATLKPLLWDFPLVQDDADLDIDKLLTEEQNNGQENQTTNGDPATKQEAGRPDSPAAGSV